PSEQKRLRRVLKRYHAWLQRLPKTDRHRLEEARDGRERLRIVKELRQREWVRRLPPTVQASLKGLEGDELQKKIEQLRKEQRRRQRAAQQRFVRPGGGPGGR